MRAKVEFITSLLSLGLLQRHRAWTGNTEGTNTNQWDTMLAHVSIYKSVCVWVFFIFIQQQTEVAFSQQPPMERFVLLYCLSCGVVRLLSGQEMTPGSLLTCALQDPQSITKSQRLHVFWFFFTLKPSTLFLIINDQGLTFRESYN